MSSKPSYSQDTIVAAATPAGVGGIAIVRISGPEAAKIARTIGGELPQPRQATLGTFKDTSGDTIDQGMLLWFPAPHSFTGEDVVELHAHGGPVIVDSLIEAALELGARRADAGEFSKRAFLNDKLDLLQAEAIADLIGSGTRQAARAALRSLSGEFSAAITALQSRLTDLRTHVEAALDFPEEEIDFLGDDALLARIDDCGLAFDQLARRAQSGRILRDGFQMVIIGRPNAGKSSLMNRLSGEETAIVTDIAGTTRDVLKETINIDGLAVELVDTAGLRADPDRIEAEGIRRARDAIAKADAVLWLVDASTTQEDTLRDLEPGVDPATPIMVVRNKIDLTGGPAKVVGDEVSISAKSGQGLDELRRQIRRLAGYRDHGEGAFTARRRHVNAIEAARRHFDLGQQQLRESHAGEIFAEELRMAQQQLSEITGELSSDDLLGRIFSSFCIGK